MQNPLSPFSEVQQQYINNLKPLNVLEGAVRSGKSLINTMLFALNLEQSDDELHIISAKSVSTAKFIFASGNGYGLENIYNLTQNRYLRVGECKLSLYKNKECILIRTWSDKRKVCIFTGGSKKGDDEFIRGMSIGSWLATEIDLHTPEFIQELFRRLAISKQMMVFWDLNPTNKGHYIYTNYIDHFIENKPNFINYAKVTIFDNLSFNENQLNLFLSTYKKDSIWYKRDVLGERINLEGAIYPNFKNHHKINLDAWQFQYHKFYIGIDWGYNGSATAMVFVGITNKDEVVILDEFYKKDDERSSSKNLQYAHEFIKKHQRYAPTVFSDSADRGMFLDLADYVHRHFAGVSCKGFKKMKIIDRIRLTDHIMANDKLFVSHKCKATINAFESAVYDDNKITNSSTNRLDNGTYNVDSLDAFEYACVEFFRGLDYFTKIINNNNE